MFLIAGGPGQAPRRLDSATHTARLLYRFLFPGYTLVAYDDRGTGSPASCAAPRSSARHLRAEEARSCLRRRSAPARLLQHERPRRGPRGRPPVARRRRSGSSGCPTARNLHGVRAAHPDHVERLLLDSVLPPELPDPFVANVLHEMPANAVRVLRRRRLPAPAAPTSQASRRRSRTGSDGARRRHGSEATAARRGRSPSTAVDLLSVLLGRRPQSRPRGRAAAASGRARATPAAAAPFALGSQRRSTSMELSGLYAATTCRDGPFPWSPDTPIADRPALGRPRSRASRPVVGPFGTGRPLRERRFCLEWPSRPAAHPRRRPAAECPDARNQRRLRHAHADRQRRLRRCPLPAGSCSSCRASGTAPSPPTSPPATAGRPRGCRRPCRLPPPKPFVPVPAFTPGSTKSQPAKTLRRRAAAETVREVRRRG